MIALEPATLQDAELLSNLLQLYLHDLSEVFPIELDPSGRFVYDKLPLYWSEPESRFPFLIRSDGRAVGFVLVTRGSPASDDPNAFDVAEFFVARRERRSGAGGAVTAVARPGTPHPWRVFTFQSPPAPRG